MEISRFHSYNQFQQVLKGFYMMKLRSEQEFIAQAVQAVQKCLGEVPFWRLAPSEPVLRTAHETADAALKILQPEGERLLLIEARRSGEPRSARDAVNSLARLRNTVPDAYFVFVAPYISPAAAELTNERNVGYVDLSGNCRLCFDRVYIRREGSPNQMARRRDLRSLYSPKAERVLRALLLEPRRAWKVEQLAEAADVSLGQASNVKRLLDDREWLGRGPQGIVLQQPAKLLAEWARNYRFDRNETRSFYSPDPLPLIEAKLAASRETCGEYALTGFSAAARLAPTVRYQRATAYVAQNIDELARCMGLKPVDSGANVSLIEPYDEGVFAGATEINGLRIASSVQTYLDVLNSKARGQEAAEAVLNEVIKPTW
jgi:hypothetical protein